MSEDDSKARDDSVESSDEDESFGPAALGLHRVGTELPKKKKTSPLQKLNARGRPARIRRKNTKYDDEAEEAAAAAKTPLKGSPVKKAGPSKTPISTPVKPGPKSSKKRAKETESEEEEDDAEDESEDGSGKSAVLVQKIMKKAPKKRSYRTAAAHTSDAISSNIDKKACQRIGLRLRNLLKLPKAHKFVMYEFFYSNIDRAIFLGTNDFETCLDDTFPRLKTRMLTRIEWNKIRRTFGKPRRCSSKFFEEERIELERKRQKIRLLQSRKTGDASFVCDLPMKIPIPFTIGTKVTARLRSPQDGLFTGTIDGLVHKSHSYRIVFERQGIGSQEIPDYEVMAAEFGDVLDVIKLTKEFISRPDISYYMVSPLKPAGAYSSFGGPISFQRGDPMLSSASNSASFIKLEGYQRPKLPNLVLPTTGSIGGYPIKLLETMVLVRKTLEIKHLQLLKIRRLNVEAEVVKSFGDNAPDDFQKKYASLLVEMERINRDLADYLNILQAQVDLFVTDKDELEIITPTYLREKCKDLAMQTFAKNNNNAIQDDTMIKLIGNLTTIMWVTSNLKNEQYSNVEEVLNGCLLETSKSLDPDNRALFEKNVNSHIQQIQIGIFDEMGHGQQNAEIEILEEEEVVEEDVDDYVLGI